MAISTIYPNGVNEVIVPATQSIAISNFGGGIASIYYLIVNANRPASYQLQQTLNNSSVVLGAFADGMTIKIEAGPSVVRYDVGASPDTGIGDADTLNGLASDTAATADTIAARDSSGDITANAFYADGAEEIKIELTGATNPLIRFYEGAVAKGYIRWMADGYMRIRNFEDTAELRIKNDIEYSPNGSTIYNIYHEGTSSASDTFTTADAKTVTVVNGLITSIV